MKVKTVNKGTMSGAIHTTQSTSFLLEDGAEVTQGWWGQGPLEEALDGVRGVVPQITLTAKTEPILKTIV